MGLTLACEFFVFWGRFLLPLLFSFLITVFLGGCITIATYTNSPKKLEHSQIFLTTCLVWFVLSLTAALPFYWSFSYKGWTWAWFEAVSALTTTGFSDIPTYAKSLIFWRCLLHWLGGIGIIAMALTLFPALRLGGMQLFHTEFSDRSQKLQSRVSEIATSLLSIYFLLTLLCCLILWALGLSFWDSFFYALSTVSTTGFEGGVLRSPEVDLVLTFFMLLGGSPLILLARYLYKDVSLKEEGQWKLYLSIVFFTTLIVGSYRSWYWQEAFHESLLKSFHAVASFTTTTGVTLSESWTSFSVIIFFILSFIGGCTGSTTGGLKIFRLKVLIEVTRCQFMQILKPHGVFVPFYQDQKIKPETAQAVFAFLFLYVACFAGLSLGFCGLGYSLSFSLVHSWSCLTNLGGGLVAHSFPLSSSAKLLSMFGMLLGRLEILTILMVFIPASWRR